MQNSTQFQEDVEPSMRQSEPTVETKDASSKRTRTWRERALAPDEIFQGADEVGRSGWFLRFAVTGMYPRRIGPFDSYEDALAVHESLVDELITAFIDAENDLECWQACFVEEVPRLVAPSPLTSHS